MAEAMKNTVVCLHSGKQFVYTGEMSCKQLINFVRLNSPTWIDIVDDKGLVKGFHTDDIETIEEILVEDPTKYCCGYEEIILDF